MVARNEKNKYIKQDYEKEVAVVSIDGNFNTSG